jgi:hypothetical protein
MSEETNLAILRDLTKGVVQRIRAAVQLELDYWDDPNKSPPNLSRAEFHRLLVYIPLNAHVRWEERKSSQGTYGDTGEDQVFNIEFEIQRGRKKFVYYLKGYFFEKDELKGICIQSFRLERSYNIQKLRVIGRS